MCGFSRTLFSLLLVYKIKILRSSNFDVNLPENHMPYYYRQFPNELKKCLESDGCPYKTKIPNELPCWGYEHNCKKSGFSKAECPLHHKGWVKTKKEQIDTFYEQGDFGYIKQRLKSIRLLCEPTFKDDTALECSEHLEFCRGRNLFINFTSLSSRKEPFRYKMDVLSEGDIGGYCLLHKKRLSEEADRISPLQSWGPEMRHFTEMAQRPLKDNLCDIVLEKPTFVMKIDATVNMYHHLCDFFNLYASLHMNISHPSTFSSDVFVLLWETYPYYSAFGEMWKAFSSNPILTLANFSGKTICFKNVVFPLLPRMIFGLYYNTPIIYGCEKSGLFKAFSEFILHRLQIPINSRNNSKIHITLLSRETSYRNILNEKELITALEENRDYEIRRTVFNRLIPFKDQLEIIRNTDILIGMHGAGLTHLLFLPDWAGIFELYNCEDENCYLDLARLRGIKYITWENLDKLVQQDEGHHPDGGSHAKFTNYSFDVDEFLRLVKKLAEHVRRNPDFIRHLDLKKNSTERKLHELNHDEL